MAPGLVSASPPHSPPSGACRVDWKAPGGPTQGGNLHPAAPEAELASSVWSLSPASVVTAGSGLSPAQLHAYCAMRAGPWASCCHRAWCRGTVFLLGGALLRAVWFSLFAAGTLGVPWTQLPWWGGQGGTHHPGSPDTACLEVASDPYVEDLVPQDCPRDARQRPLHMLLPSRLPQPLPQIRLICLKGSQKPGRHSLTSSSSLEDARKE